MIVAQLRARMIVRMSKPGRRRGAGLDRSGQVRFGQVRSVEVRSGQRKGVNPGRFALPRSWGPQKMGWPAKQSAIEGGRGRSLFLKHLK